MRPTEQAFSVFLKDLKGFSENQQINIVEQIRIFTGVKRRSVLQWIQTGKLSNGLFFLKIRHILVVLGYRTISLEEIPENLQKLCSLLAHDAVKQSEICAFLALSSSDDLWRPILEQKNPRKFSQERMEKVREFCEINKHHLAAIEDLDKNLRSIFLGENIHLTQRIEPPTKFEKTSERNLEDGLHGTSYLVSAILPSLNKLFMEGTVEDRQEFRTKFGTNALFLLSNQQHEFSRLLNGLCSEKSREIVIKK